MGNTNSINDINKVNFENVQDCVKNINSDVILLNTLDKNKQEHVIKHTTSIQDEEHIINKLINNNNKTKTIYIYGENNNDTNVISKYIQLKKLGFCNTYIYLGGLFEWLLLQDIYGADLFPTSKNIDNIDFLIYKPHKNKH